jgi:hypothetical protein
VEVEVVPVRFSIVDCIGKTALTYGVETQEPFISSTLRPFLDFLICAQIMPCLSSTLVKQTPSGSICCCRLLSRERLQAAVSGLGSIGRVAIDFGFAPSSYHVELRRIEKVFTKVIEFYDVDRSSI